MTAQVLSFFRRSTKPSDWSAQEVAEFYRVEAALIQAGLHVESERGLTDEGEPWFVFCRTEDDEVVIHFARIDGEYVISAPAYCGDAVGYDFRALVRSMIERHPVLRPKPSDNNLFLHPASLLVVLVASALLKAGHAAAAPAAGQETAGDGKSYAGAPAMTVQPEPPHEALMLAAINAAIAAPVLVETASVVLSTAAHASDSINEPLAPLPNAPYLDQPHQPLLTDESGTATAASVFSHSTTVTSVDVVLAHTAPTNNASLAADSQVTPNPQAQPPLDAHPIPAAPFVAAADLSVDVQHVSLSTLTNIPQSDQVILQALGVTNAATVSSTLPDTFSVAIQSGDHVEVANPHAAHTSPAEATTAMSAPVVSSPSAAAAPAAAPVPDLSAVMAGIIQFQAVEIQPVVLITDHAAIFYDAHAVATDLPEVRSVTYDFQDGFSISLVGLPAELAHAVIHM